MKKKNISKAILNVVLSFVLAVGMIPSTAFASNAQTNSQSATLSDSSNITPNANGGGENTSSANGNANDVNSKSDVTNTGDADNVADDVTEGNANDAVATSAGVATATLEGANSAALASTATLEGANSVTLAATTKDYTYSGGTGTEEDPYLISKAQDMWDLAEYANSFVTYTPPKPSYYYKVTADIDLGCSAENPWVPIGKQFYSGSTNTFFNGVFDGDNHIISGLYIDSTDKYCGLFAGVGGTGEGTIKNFLVQGEVKGGTYSAGVCGYISWKGKIENVGNEARVSCNSGYNYCAGIVGYAQTSNANSALQINNCWNSATIGSESKYGAAGILSYSYGDYYYAPVLTNCCNTGEILGPASTYYGMGGLIAQVVCGKSSGTSILNNCYNASKVSTGHAITSYGLSYQNASNVYYNSDLCEKALGGNNYGTRDITALTTEEMQSESFVSKLGDAYVYSAGNYPKLKAQMYYESSPNITEQPEDVSIMEGDAASELSVYAQRSTYGPSSQGTLTYQWYQADDAQGSNARPINGEIYTTFTPTETKAGIYYYYCEVTNTFDRSGVKTQGVAKSDVSTYIISADVDCAKPNILAQPLDMQVPYGTSNQQLAVAAEVSGVGAGKLSYQWYSADNAQGDNAKAIEGATTTSYTPDTFSLDDAYFFCEVTNTYPGRTMQETVRTNVACVSVSDTVEVASATELQAISNNISSGKTTYDGITIKLTSDIDLSSVCGKVKGNWQPIGSTTTGCEFTGTFDGQYHTVSNLYAYSDGNGTADSKYLALFGNATNGATIKNLTVGGYVHGYQYIAGVLARGEGVTLENLCNNATIEHRGNDGAGVVGYLDSNEGYSTYANNLTNHGSVTLSTPLGNVFGAGGVIGWTANTNTTQTVVVTNCYNTGNVTGDANYSMYTGGVCGQAQKVTFENCYSSGVVDVATKDNARYNDVLFGANSPDTTPFTNCYYVSDDASAVNNRFGTVVSTTDAKAAGFVDKLGKAYKAGSTYPILLWELTAQGAPFITKNPADAVYKVGDEAQPLTVKAEVVKGTPSLSYQWYVASTEDLSDAKAINGAKEASYTPSTEKSGAYYYYCVVTNTQGSTEYTAQSEVAAVAVNSETPAAKPTISTQPASEDVAFGASPKELSVTANVSDPGAGTLSYQWYESDTDNFEEAQAIDGATDKTYTPTTTQGETKYYFCQVTNTFEITKTATATSTAAKIYVDNVMTVSTADEFVKFYDDIDNKSGYENVIVRLTNDIDLTQTCAQTPWEAKGTFKGTFDGAGYTISGFSSTTSGLFLTISGNAVLENFILKGDITISDWNNIDVGAVTSSVSGVKDKTCYIRNVGSEVNITISATSSSSSYVAGIVAKTDNYSYDNCYCYIDSCYNKGEINVTSTATLYSSVSGVCANGYSSSRNFVSNCYNTGNITVNPPNTSGSPRAVGVAGKSFTASNCYNKGTVTQTKNSSYACACVYSDWNTKAENCYYLAGGTQGTVSGVSLTSKTEDEMKQDSFVEALGDAYIATSGAYPRLTWEGAKITITQQPESALYKKGETPKVLKSTAEKPVSPYKGSNGTLTYQWYKASGSLPAPATDARIENATSDSFTPPTTATGATSYYCVVTNKYGDVVDTATSDIATITVTDASPAPVTVSKQPTGGSYVQAKSTPLEVAASLGSGEKGTLTYQWYIADSATDEGTPISGATKSALEANERALGDHYYYCKVSNTIGGIEATSATSNRAKVTVSAIQISSATELKEISDNVTNGVETYYDCTIQLTCDIDLSSVCGEGVGNWSPIGKYTNASNVMGSGDTAIANREKYAFRGTFDGQGHTIKNLYASGTLGSLFGVCNGATLKNFILTGNLVSQPQYAAAVCSLPASTLVQNVGNECNVQSSQNYIAGILAQPIDANYIENCYNKATIEGYNSVNGIGMSMGGYGNTFAKNCYNTGNISATRSVNGIGSNTCENCYNIGTITSSSGNSSYAMGIKQNSTTNCYTTPTGKAVSDGTEEITADYAATKDLAEKLGDAFVFAGTGTVLSWEVAPGYPTITQQPIGASYVQGQRSQALSVEAQLPTSGTGADGKLSYQWFEAFSEDLSDAKAIEGATSATYDFKTFDMTPTTHYIYCEVTNTFAGGSSTIPSSPAKVVITSTIDPATPSFNLQPKSATYDRLMTLKARTLNVSLAETEGVGFGDITYQWYCAPSASVEGTPINGATSTSYTPDVSTVSSKYYYCVATNTFEGSKVASTKSDIVLIMVYNSSAAVPTISKHPTSTATRYTQGDVAEDLSVEAALPTTEPGSAGTLSYQWYRNTTGTANVSTDEKISGATKATYKPDTSISPDIYYYYCVVTNTYFADGSQTAIAKSNLAKIELVSKTEAAVPAATIDNASYEFEGGSSATEISAQVTCADEGKGNLTYQWYKTTSNTASDSDEAVSGAAGDVPEDGVVKCTPSTKDKAGTYYYYCKITNTFENVKYATANSNLAEVKLTPALYIYSADDLIAFRNNVNNGTTYAGLTVCLMSDIDLAGSDTNQWVAIGNTSKIFSGFFEGNGHTISGLYINSTESTYLKSYLGLFGQIGTSNGACGVYDTIVKGDINLTYTYDNTNMRIGGIVGYAMQNAEFENCGNEVNIYINHTKFYNANYRTDSLGGIVGYCSNLKHMTNCYNTGNMTFSDITYTNVHSAGGLIGYDAGSTTALVENCYNTGNISNAGLIGGLVGQLNYNTKLRNSYTTGIVVQKTGYSGSNYNSASATYASPSNVTIDSLYYLNEAYTKGTPKGEVAAVKSMTADDMKAASFVDTLNSGTTGKAFVEETGKYPLLAWQKNEVVNAAQFTTQPEDDTYATKNADATPLKVEAEVKSGKTGTITYQWYKNSEASTSGAEKIDDATGKTYKPDTSVEGGEYYYCVATHTLGTTKVDTVSNIVLFTTTATNTEAATPSLPTQPKGANYDYNQKDGVVELSVKAFNDDEKTGVGDVTYQWYSSKTDSFDEATAIKNATDNTYTPSTTATGDTYYFCEVTNTFEDVKVKKAVSQGAKVYVSDTMEVKSAEELKAIATLVNSGVTLSGVTVKLTQDIDLSSVCSAEKGNWTPIGQNPLDNGSPFKGTFDGQGHTISGFYINSTDDEDGPGLFGCAEDATIKNFILKGEVHAEGYSAAVLNYASGGVTIENVRNEASVTVSGECAAGIVYRVEIIDSKAPIVIKNCANAGKIESNYNNGGGSAGIVYVSYGPTTIENCYNSADISAVSRYAAGIIARARVDDGDVSIKSCYNTGNIKATNYVGGIVGYKGGSDYEYTATNNYYLTGTATTDKGNAKQMSADDMKASSFVDTLNGSDGNAYAVVKDSYPRLSWEVCTLLSDVATLGTIDAQAYTGEAIEPDVTVTPNDAGTTLTKGKDYKVEYSDNKNAGTAKVTVTGMGDYYGTLEGEFTITGKDLTAGTIEGLQNSYTYTGSAVVPTITVKDKDGAVLTADKDYTVALENNTDAGQATLTIKGTGQYTGEITKTFNIAAADITSAKAADIATQAYTGSEIKPDVTLTMGESGSEVTLKEGTDYTLEYASNTDEGQATITITGKGNYAGTKTVNFTIEKASLQKAEISGIESGGYPYTGKAVCPEPVVKIGDKTLVKDTDYTIEYKNNVNVSDSAPALTIKAKSDGAYTGESNAVSFKINQADISSVATFSKIDDQTWTGSELKPAVTVSIDGVEIASSNFAFEYTENTEVGTGKVAISAKSGGNFTGTKELSFNIVAADISGATVSVTPATATYTGATIEPANVVVTSGGKTLTADTDYTYATTNNTNVGKATVTVTGKGHYKNTATQTFDITAASLSTAKITVDEQTYTGEALEPALSVKFGDVDVPASAYTAKYTNNINAGTANVEIVANEGSNFTAGTKATGTFTIKKASQVAPSSIARANESVEGLKDGAIYNLDDTMEWRIVSDSAKAANASAQTESAWTSIPSGENRLTGLSAGTYEIRYKETANLSAGEAAKVVLISTIVPEYTLGVDEAAAEGLKLDNLIYAYTTQGGATTKVTNTGNIKQTGFKVAVTGDDASAFSAQISATELDAEKSLDVTVTTAKGLAAGTYIANVTVTSNEVPDGVTFPVSVTVDPLDITYAQVNATGTAYTGAVQTPAVSVSMNGVALVANTDYTTPVYADNKNAGVASVSVKGAGNYTGTAKGTFQITKANLVVIYKGETISYGETPSLKLDTFGFVGGESASTLGVQLPTLTNTNTAPGSYTLTPAGGSATNYEIVCVPGTLVINQVDTSALKSAIEAANVAETGVKVSKDGSDVDPADTWVTQSAKDALNSAISAALAVANNTAATQKQVEDAISAINNATQTFNSAKKAGTKTEPVDATSLNSAIEAAQAAETGVKISTDGADVDPADTWVTQSVKDALDSAIAAAQAVANNSSATQAEVDAATVSLNNATQTFNSAKKAGTKAEPVAENVVSRVYGKTAADTAVEIVKTAYPEGTTCENAVLACDFSFYDAMSAAGLAGALNAPIMLTAKDGLTAATLQEMKALGVKNVYIIGGKFAISQQVEADLKAAGINVAERVYGSEAEDTSEKCAETIARIRTAAGQAVSDKVIVATSYSFQDALSIAGYAYQNCIPILLQSNGESSAVRHFTDDQKALLTTGIYKDANIIVVGGSGAVSNESFNGVCNINDKTKFARYYGESAYDTSAIIAKTFFANATKVIIATGEQDALGLDALAGAALGGKLGAPTLLVEPKGDNIDYTAVDQFITSANKDKITNAYILGGSGVMPKDTISAHVCNIFGQKEIA